MYQFARSVLSRCYCQLSGCGTWRPPHLDCKVNGWDLLFLWKNCHPVWRNSFESFSFSFHIVLLWSKKMICCSYLCKRLLLKYKKYVRGNTEGKTTEQSTAEITLGQIWKYQCWCVHLFLQWVFELHRWIDSHRILSILTVWQSWEIILVASSSSATFLSTKIMFGNFSNLHVLIFRISQKDLIWMKVCHGSGSSPHTSPVYLTV